MYHVKKDRRSLTSAHAIYKGLATLLKSKSYDTITVSEICELADISRATFYRNFDIIEDVLSWYGEIQIRRIVNDYYSTPEANRKPFMHFALSYALEEAEFVEILTSVNKLYLIELAVIRMLDIAPLDYDPSKNPYTKYAISAKTGSFFGIIHCWIMTGKKESVDEMIAHMQEIEETASKIAVKLTL